MVYLFICEIILVCMLIRFHHARFIALVVVPHAKIAIYYHQQYSDDSSNHHCKKARCISWGIFGLEE